MKNKTCTFGVVVAVWLMGAVACRTAVGQSDGFLCSAGPRDGTACTSDDDCFVSCPSSFGACVFIQGVCNGGNVDGFPCDCPEGACVGSGTTGTCQGGVFNGDACNPTEGSGGCGTGVACSQTQKICNSGDFKGFGCLKTGDCAGDVSGTCVSTGRFCDGGDFADYSCVDSADCNATSTDGVCSPPSVDCTGTTVTPTPTRTITRTRTPSRTPTGNGLTATPTRTSTPGSPVPTNTASATVPPQFTPTSEPTTGLNARVAAFTPRGSIFLPLVDASNLPTGGTIVKIGSRVSCTSFTRNALGNTLSLNPELAEDVPEGTVIQVGPCEERNVFVQKGGGCAIVGPSNDGVMLLIIGVAFAVLGRKSARRSN